MAGDNDDYEVTGAELHHRDSEWFLHLRTKAEVESDTVEQATTGHSTVLGVDLDVNQLAVTSTGTFWSGHEFDHWRREYEKRRASLQQCGSRHAHENIQAVGRKEAGRFTMMLHRSANGIIEEAAENGCTVIAFEELTGIRDRLSGASWGHKWAFERLYEYVEYKAEPRGITVEQVDPENTSRRCSTCGFTHPDNRDGEDFECLKCGYENHADYNAAKNIGLRYLRRNQTGDGGGAPVGVRLNRGTLNANGEYDPPAGNGQSGSPRESHPHRIERRSRERVGWGSLHDDSDTHFRGTDHGSVDTVAGVPAVRSLPAREFVLEEAFPGVRIAGLGDVDAH